MLSVLEGWTVIFLCCSLIPVIVCTQEQDISCVLPQMVRQKVFIEEKFHYLHVPAIGVSEVHDVFDCTFGCLSNLLCLSVNLASAKGTDAVKSCKDFYEIYKPSVSKLVTLTLSAKPISILCHMGNFGCGDGGWTPVMKIDGNKNTFHYNSGYWTDTKEYNVPAGKAGFDSEETKLPTYWNTPFSKICLGMKVGQRLSFIVINKQANSLHSLIADRKYHATSLGRNTWKTLIGSQASLQLNCNREGFNLICGYCRVRIGIATNNENGCNSCDSRIGFGTGGCHFDHNTCGNGALHSPDNENKNIKAMGYILVQ